MNFMEVVRPLLTPALMQKAAAWLGESESGISKALSTIFPTLMGAALTKADNRSFVETLSSLLASPDLNAAALLSEPTQVYNSTYATHPTGALGASLLSALFGDKQQALGSAISQHAGIGMGSVGKLLGASAPVLLALLKTQSQASGGLTALMASFAGQKSALIASIPGGIGAAAGLNGAGAATAASSFSANTAKSQAGSKSNGFPLWLIPILALIGVVLWWFLKGDRAAEPLPNTPATEPAAQVQPVAPATPAPQIEPVATPATQPAVIDVPISVGTDATQVADPAAFTDRTLPDNTTIRIRGDGSEAKLLGFIEDATQVVDKETWVELDGILFDSDTASLREQSSAQVANIAAILKAFPDVQLKIGGYTDNSGDAANNLKLSAERANLVMNAISALGVDAARLKAEGYGPAYPVADNATEDGRQKNRRVSVRVTAK